MFAIFFLAYGIGFEGYENGKWYFGAYTPTREYGWVVTEKEIYLDTILEKRLDKPSSIE